MCEQLLIKLQSLDRSDSLAAIRAPAPTTTRRYPASISQIALQQQERLPFTHLPPLPKIIVQARPNILIPTILPFASGVHLPIQRMRPHDPRLRKRFIEEVHQARVSEHALGVPRMERVAEVVGVVLGAEFAG